MFRSSVYRSRLLICLFTIAVAPGSYATAQTDERPPVRSPGRLFERRVVSWNELKTQNIVMQRRDFSCGAAAMATVLRYHWGEDVNETQILVALERMLTPEQLRDREERGLLLGDLEDVAKEMGYVAATGTLKLDKLLQSKVPVVVGIRFGETNHFVVFRGWYDRFVFLADPIRGNVRMTRTGFADKWIENAILVVAPQGKTKSNVSRLGVRQEEVTRGWLLKQQVRRQVTR